MKRRVSKKSELRSVLQRRQWSAVDAARILAALAASGESVAGFTRRHGMHRSRLDRWRSRLKAADTGSARPRFHPVQVVDQTVSEGAPEVSIQEMELILAGGRRVAVRRGFDPSLLMELVEAVESWSC
jgi:transposase-like protein